MTGTVTLTGTAPLGGGAIVTLSSSSTAATVPATVTVPAGSTSATFTVSTSAVSSNQTVTITANYGGGSAQATLTVTAPSGGGTLPQFSFLSNTSPGTSGFIIAPGLVDEAAISAGIIGSTEVLSCGAEFTGYTVSGTTITPTGLDLNNSTCTAHFSTGQSTVAGITSAMATITLSPVVPDGTSGNASWTVNIVSSLGTITQSYTGTYTATLATP